MKTLIALLFLCANLPAQDLSSLASPVFKPVVKFSEPIQWTKEQHNAWEKSILAPSFPFFITTTKDYAISFSNPLDYYISDSRLTFCSTFEPVVTKDGNRWIIKFKK